MSYKMFDNFLDACIVFNNDNNKEIIYRNQAAASLAQRSLMRMYVGSSMDKYFEFENLENLLEASREKYVETTYKTSCGHSGTVSITSQHMNYENHWLCVIRDMSMEVKLHKKYQLQLREKEKYNLEMKSIVDERTMELRELYDKEKQSRSELEKVYYDVKKMQAQLIEGAKLASLGKMSAGIAHELNNPLTCIQGYSEIVQKSIKKEKCNEKIFKMLDGIQNASRRMSAIIGSLKKFGENTFCGKRGELSLDVPISNTINFLAPFFKKHDIRIDFHCPPNPGMIIGDVHLLESVFSHLLSNSKDAFEKITDDRNKKVEIKLSSDKDNIKVLYRDNASGMSDDVIKKIFDPFYTTKDVGRGAGLGMSVVHGIIKEHQASISVKSVEGQFSECIIKFPAF